MRIGLALVAISLVAALSGCTVLSAGASVVGTAADVAGDIVTAPFPKSDSDSKKK